MSSSLKILEGLSINEIADIVFKFCDGDKQKLYAFLQDEKKVKLANANLVDEDGRIIPSKDLNAMFCIPNRDLYLKQPEMKDLNDFEDRIVRFREAFNRDRIIYFQALDQPCLTAEKFYSKANKMIDEIRKDENIANLLEGVYLPIVLPHVLPQSTYGQILEEVFLPAMEYSFKKHFPNREFDNSLRDIGHKIGIVEGTRHEKLIEKMKCEEEFVVAIYFPNPLQGFSVEASRKQLSVLPQSFLLGGGFDTFTAVSMYPDILARNFNVPGYDLSALRCLPLFNLSLCLNFHYGGGNLQLKSKDNLEDADGNFSSSLLFL